MKPSFPDKNCEVCNRYDWVWHQEYNKYICGACGWIPVTNNTQEWIDRTLEDFNKASYNLEDLVQSLEPGSLIEPIVRGKIKKAREKLKIISKKADVALLMDELKTNTKHGEIYIGVSELDLDLFLTW